MKGKRGFTLIEMVVVLAVVAILAAILVPTIERNISDAKIARANNEVQVLAAAMASFYKDVGFWPHYKSYSNEDEVNFLVSADGSEGNNTTYDWWATPNDTFENQLISNAPGYERCAADTQENCWKGPYIADVKADPWGHKYSSNVSHYADSYALWVYSAGPNGIAETNPDQTRDGAALSNDDIGVRLR